MHVIGEHMRKIALSMLVASLIAGMSFAASSYISFINPGDAKVFDEKGNPVKREDLYEGYILATGETPVTLEKNNDTVVVDKSSIVAASAINDKEIQLYLFNGKTDVAHGNSTDIVISTPWSKYFATDSANFSVISNDEEETVHNTKGIVYAVNNLSNEVLTISEGEYYNALSIPDITFSPAGAFALTPERAYERGKLTMPSSPKSAPGFTNAYTFPTPENSAEYNKADDWALISGDYSHFIKSSIESNKTTEKTNRPIVINNGMAVEDFAVGQLPGMDQYIANKADGGVKFQMYSNTDAIGHLKNAGDPGWMTNPGELYTNSLSIAALPYVKFGSSNIELRLNIGIDPSTGKPILPWETINFDNAANGIASIVEYINDINIENTLFISRSRDLPLKLSPMNLLSHVSDGVKVPLLLDADMKFIRLNVFAEDLSNINAKDGMRTATLSIIPARGLYDFSLNLGVIYHRTTATADASQMLFNASLDFPILKNNVLSISIHGGLPWSWRETVFTDLFNNPDTATFYTGLYFTSEFGPFKGIVGVDYNQNRIFTGYLNKFASWSFLDLLNKDVQGLKSIVPYLNASADFGYAGLGFMITGAIFVGDTKPTTDANYNNLAMYALNSKISAFVRPFGNDALKLTVEYDLSKVYKDAYTSATGALKPYDAIKQNWVPNFIISSQTGPVFIKGTLDFEHDKNNTLQPKIGLLMSVNLGSDFVFNPSYYRSRNSKITKRANEWSPVVNLEVADEVHFFNLLGTGVSVFNSFRFKPIVGVEHPIFALKVQLEVSDISFSDFNNAASWTAGHWIDRLVNQLRFEKIFNFEANSSYNINKHSVISYSPVRERPQMDLNLFNIFGINIRNFTTWLDTIILKNKLEPTDAFVGYKSNNLNVFLAATATGEWTSNTDQNPLDILLYPTINFDINISGAKIGLFFGTTLNFVQDRTRNNELQFILGMSGKFNAWDLLAGATLGYENSSFLFEVTGGVQQNRATYKRFDALSIGTNDDIQDSTYSSSSSDMAYRVYDENGEEVTGELVPFFDVSIGGKVDGIFSLKLSYNINVNSSFKKLYYDRLSASLNITTSVVDIFGVLEKRGAFFGGDLKTLWSAPTDARTAFAYKAGATVKADFATFTIEYANEFFGGKINARKATGELISSANTGTLSFKAVLGLL